jgi:hypothetical protein
MDPLGVTNSLVLMGLMVLAGVDLRRQLGARPRRVGQWLLVYISLYSLSRAFVLRDVPATVTTNLVAPRFPVLMGGYWCAVLGLAWTEGEEPAPHCWSPRRVFFGLSVVGYGLVFYYLLWTPRYAFLDE